MSPTRARACAAAIALALLACGGTSEPRAPDLLRLLRNEAMASIGNETRLALFLKPPERPRHRFEVTLPASPTLSFGLGIPNASLAVEARPATFEIAVETGGERRVVGRRRVDPGTFEHRRWFDARVDLSAWQGRDVTLEFRIVPDAEGEGPVPLGAISDPVVVAGGHTAQHPNVVVVSIDTLRARNVGAYGYPRDTTPFFDSLAENGTLFENAITTSVTTGPSHMSLFTGLYPVNHGLRTGLEYKADEAITLAGAFRAAGYQTAAFTENGYIVRARGFGEGFSEYTENKGDKKRGPGEVRITFPQARHWLRSHTYRPFFLFVHTYEAHAPFRPPPEYSRLFLRDGHPGPEEPLMRRHRNNYDREIRFVDDELSKLVATLDELGVREDTLLVVTSDHGEEFREHGHYQHGGAVFEETIRIPLVLSGPGVPAGRRIEPQVSLIDVLPTVVDLAGLDVAADFDGISLAPAIRGDRPLAPRTLFAEAHARKRWLAPFRGQTWNPPLIAVRTQDEKFIVHRPSEGEVRPPERYDLVADALERSPQPVDAETLARIDALVDEYEQSRLSDEERPAADSPESLDPELRERLRLLGYLDE